MTLQRNINLSFPTLKKEVVDSSESLLAMCQDPTFQKIRVIIYIWFKDYHHTLQGIHSTSGIISIYFNLPVEVEYETAIHYH